MNKIIINQDKQKASATIIIILLVIICMGIIIRTNNYIKNKDPKDEGSHQETVQILDDSQREGFLVESEGSLEDLKVGEKIIIMGVQDESDSIVADIIYFGLIKPNFPNASGFSLKNMTAKTGPPESNKENIDPEEFRNLSIKEKEEHMKELRGDSNNSFKERSDNGFLGIRGEIINKDEATLIIKLADGGSRIIFYSDKTKIIKILEDEKAPG